MTLNDALALADTLLTIVSTVCVVAAWLAIRKKRVARHRNLMFGGVVSSFLFLVLFVYRFVRFGFASPEHTRVGKGIYYAILLTHEPLAVICIPLVLTAVFLGLGGSVRAHREVARIALPIWLFVLLSGIAIYAISYPLR